MRWCSGVLLLALAACERTPEVSGEVRFAEGMPVPAIGELRVVLQDTSRADAAAIDLVESVLTPPYSNPARFRIPFDRGVIDEGHSYTVRATVKDAGRLLQTTDTVVPVITRGAPTQGLMLQLVAVKPAPGESEPRSWLRGEVFDREGQLVLINCDSRGEMRLAPGAQADSLRARLDSQSAAQGVGMLTELAFAPADAQGQFGIDSFETFPRETCGSPGVTAELLDNYFVATRIGGHPVPRELPRDAQFVLHSKSQQVRGSSGCRKFEGRYVLEGASLRFEDFVVEAPTCGNASATQDSRLIEALSATRTYQLSGIHLDLLGERGEPVARLESRPLR